MRIPAVHTLPVRNRPVHIRSVENILLAGQVADVARKRIVEILGSKAKGCIHCTVTDSRTVVVQCIAAEEQFGHMEELVEHHKDNFVYVLCCLY